MNKKIIPLVAVFVVVVIGTIVFRERLTDKGVDVMVVHVGNLLLFGASVAAFMVYSSALKSKKQFHFMQKFYTGFMIKFFALVLGAILYFYFSREVNMPGIFICMALYLVYNFLSTAQVVKKK